MLRFQRLVLNTKQCMAHAMHLKCCCRHDEGVNGPCEACKLISLPGLSTVCKGEKDFASDMALHELAKPARWTGEPTHNAKLHLSTAGNAYHFTSEDFMNGEHPVMGLQISLQPFCLQFHCIPNLECLLRLQLHRSRQQAKSQVSWIGHMTAFESAPCEACCSL